MSNKKPKRQALYVTGFTTEEKEKLESFSELVGRPSSWIVRDAVKCYISSLEGETEELRENKNLEVVGEDTGLAEKDTARISD